MTRWRKLYYKTRERWNVFNTDFYCLRFYNNFKFHLYETKCFDIKFIVHRMRGFLSLAIRANNFLCYEPFLINILKICHRSNWIDLHINQFVA